MVRAKLICNPTAGRGRAGRQLPQAESILNSLGVETEVAFTRASGEAPDLTVKAIEEGFTLLIAVGGDGTVHEVANGIMLAKDTIGFAAGSAKLGIIPLGTGNDFLKMVGSDQDWRTACRRIAQGHSRRMDVGRVNERYFVNNVGIGFDAQVGIEAQKIRWLRGQAVYLAALARNMLLSYRTPHVSLQLDEEEVKQSITLLTIGNGRCSGGGFWLTPHAEIDDGLLDICLVRGLSKLHMLALVPKAMKGTHITEEPVRMTRSRKLKIASADPLPVHADGEILYRAAHRLEVELLPSALDVIG